MKTTISDLMSLYTDDTVELTPNFAVSSDRIKETVMNKITYVNQKKAPRRFARTLLIAAAAVLVLTAAVGATGLIDLSGIFGSTVDYRDRQEELQSAFTNTDNGQASVESEGTTITPLGVLCQGRHCYVTLRIEAPEGVVLEDLGQGENATYQLWGDASDEMLIYDISGNESVTKGAMLTWTPDDSAANAIICVLDVYCSDGFEDDQTLELTFFGLWTQDPYKNYVRVLDGEWSFSLPLTATEVTVIESTEQANPNTEPTPAPD